MRKQKLWMLVTAAAVLVLVGSPSWAVYTLTNVGSTWTSTTSYVVSNTFDDWARWDRMYNARAANGGAYLGNPEKDGSVTDLNADGTWNEIDYAVAQGDWWLGPRYGDDIDGNGTLSAKELSGSTVKITSSVYGDLVYTSSREGGFMGSGWANDQYAGLVALTFERGRIVNGAGADVFVGIYKSTVKSAAIGFRYDYEGDGTFTYVIIPKDHLSVEAPWIDGMLDFGDARLNVTVDGTTTDYRVPDGGLVDMIFLWGATIPTGANAIDLDGDGTVDNAVVPDAANWAQSGASLGGAHQGMGVLNYARLAWDVNGDGTFDENDGTFDFEFGDVNADGTANLADRNFIDAIVTAGVGPDSYLYNRGADLTGDDLVNQDDLDMWDAVVPEPVTLLAVGAGLVALVGGIRTRRSLV